MENYIGGKYNKHWEEYLVRNSERKRLLSSWGDDTEMEPIEIGVGIWNVFSFFAL